MESNPLRGLFGVSSPRPVEQRVAPQPTEPMENIDYEISSGVIEKLLANPYAGDGTLHPDMHLIYVDEVCGLFKLAVLPGDEVKKKVFPLSLKGRALTWYRLCDDIGAWDCNRLGLEFHQKFYPMHLVHRDGIIYIIFGLAKDKASLKLGAGSSQCYIHAPIMSSQEKLLFGIFMLGFLVMINPCSILLVLVLLR